MRKSQYHNDIYGTKGINPYYNQEYVTPIKKSPTKPSKLNKMLSRLTRQTESSERKNRNAQNKSFNYPHSYYNNR